MWWLDDSAILVLHQSKQSREIVNALWDQIDKQVEQSLRQNQPLLVLAYLDDIGQSAYARHRSKQSVSTYAETNIQGRFAFVFPQGLSIARLLKVFLLRDLNNAVPTITFQDFPTAESALEWLREALTTRELVSD